MGAFASLQDFINMGGYAAFVWPCFGLTALVLIYNFIQPRRHHQELKRQIRGRINRQTVKDKG